MLTQKMRGVLAIVVLTGSALSVGTQAMGQKATDPAPGADKKADGCCAQCPMCSRMMNAMQGGSETSGEKMGGMQGMMGMMGGMRGKMGMMGGMQGMQGMNMMGGMAQRSEPSTITVGPNGTIYVLRDGVLYKYSAALKLLGRVKLPAANMGTHTMPAGMDHAADAHAGHHH